VNPLSSPEVLFHHYSLPAFDNEQCPRPERGEAIKSLKTRVPPKTVLLSKLNPEIERVWLVDVEPTDRAICSTELLVLHGRDPYSRNYLYCLARSAPFRRQIEALATGTSKSHQRAQVDSTLNLSVALPPASIVTEFDRISETLLTRIHCNRRQTRSLAALRDTLLPRLISGELRVPDAERFLERVAA
jgi:type I restriction enzyme S subunit